MIFLNRLISSIKLPTFSVSEIIASERELNVEDISSQALNDAKFHVKQVRKFLASGEECAGLGVDLDPRKALLKATSEYFERKAVLTVGDSFGFSSTNGVASHHFLFAAKYFAFQELGERDAFLAHWYSRTPFLNMQIDTQMHDLSKKLINKNFETLFFRTHLGFVECVVCFIVDKFTGGFAVGLSSGRGSKDAQKALQEAIINMELGSYGLSKEQLLEEMVHHGVTSLQAHRSYWLYKSILPEWVLQKHTVSKKFSKDEALASTEFVQLAQHPFKVVGAKNESMIPFRVGLPTRNDLSKLTRRVEVDIESVGEWLIHPIP